MNKPNSPSVKLSPEDQQFCDNLLLLAEWLDSQNSKHTFMKFMDTDFARHYKGKSVSHPEFYPLLLEANENKTGYYDNKNVTNKERVLALLLLRSAILAGDTFV